MNKNNKHSFSPKRDDNGEMLTSSKEDTAYVDFRGRTAFPYRESDFDGATPIENTPEYIDRDASFEKRKVRQRKIRSYKHKRRKKILRIMIAILIIIVALLVLPIPFGSLEVNGSKKVTTNDVLVAADIHEPINILQIRSDTIKEKMSHDLRVEKVEITYKFPLTMCVNITDRKPIAIITTQFAFITLDKNGQAINSETAITDETVPIISGIKPGNVLLGDKLTNQSILSALTFLNALSDEGLSKIAEVNVGNPNELVAYTVDGLPIHIGDTTNLEKKAALSENMIQDIKNNNLNAEYIDVNVTSPFIKQ